VKKSKSELREIRNYFPKKLRQKLTFRKDGNYVIIGQKHRLNSHDFYKVAVAVMNLNGNYIHPDFRVSLKTKG
jgi:hypothetical protein